MRRRDVCQRRAVVRITIGVWVGLWTVASGQSTSSNPSRDSAKSQRSPDGRGSSARESIRCLRMPGVPRMPPN